MEIRVGFAAVQFFTLPLFVAIMCFELRIFFVGAGGDQKCICDGVEHDVSFRSVNPFVALLVFQMRVRNNDHMLVELSY